MPTSNETLVEKCRKLFPLAWQKMVEKVGQIGAMPDTSLDENFRQAITRCVNSKTKTYRYVLPTQLLAKAADASVDCRSLQATGKRKGAFDARSICDDIIVPFDKSNHNVLGGSPEPYVNNPLRQPEITERYRNKQKDKIGWDDLCFVLNEVEKSNEISFTQRVFEQALVEIIKRLSVVQVLYSVPKRISLPRTISLVEAYLSEQSGGDRVLAVAASIFETIGKRFNLFVIKRANINAADTSSGMVADIECVDSKGNVLLAVEVKDKALTVNQVVDKLPNLRAKQVSEILFIAQKGIEKESVNEVATLVDREFVSGQNIYVFDLIRFAESLLALIGESGRRDFLDCIWTTMALLFSIAKRGPNCFVKFNTALGRTICKNNIPQK